VKQASLFCHKLGVSIVSMQITTYAEKTLMDLCLFRLAGPRTSGRKRRTNTHDLLTDVLYSGKDINYLSQFSFIRFID